MLFELLQLCVDLFNNCIHIISIDIYIRIRLLSCFIVTLNWFSRLIVIFVSELRRVQIFSLCLDVTYLCLCTIKKCITSIFRKIIYVCAYLIFKTVREEESFCCMVYIVIFHYMMPFFYKVFFSDFSYLNQHI